MDKKQPLVAVIMGSNSDWPTMKNAAQVLADFDVPYKAEVISAHRTPDQMMAFAENAAKAGYQVIIAGAGGAAHLPGMVASKTILPVLGVPVATKHLQGQDSLLSIVQMPKGVPVATFAIGDAGATNAGLFAVSLLANQHATLAEKLNAFRQQQIEKVNAMELDDKP
ncbi:MAG: 5-(carboxyamino)imidazole ribonucleotide mutase [Methylotenera sp.]|jgi:5-(carboxyamino)imidazole ribonucleotide mutase